MEPLPFDRTEYAQRLARIRRDMASRKIDLLVVTDVANQHYITGYDGWSFYTPQSVLVPLGDEEPVWVGRAMDAAGGPLPPWGRASNPGGFPQHYPQENRRPPVGWIAPPTLEPGWGRPRHPLPPRTH